MTQNSNLKRITHCVNTTLCTPWSYNGTTYFIKHYTTQKARDISKDLKGNLIACNCSFLCFDLAWLFKVSFSSSPFSLRPQTHFLKSKWVTDYKSMYVYTSVETGWNRAACTLAKLWRDTANFLFRCLKLTTKNKMKKLSCIWWNMNFHMYIVFQ